MRGTEEKNQVSREKLQRLMSRMSRMSRKTGPESSEAQGTDCDWGVPHHFGPEAVGQLEGLSRRIALAIQKCLEESAHKNVEVIHDRLCEHYASRLSETLCTADGPYMANLLGEKQARVGFLRIPFETGAFLVAQTLHDPEAAVGQDGQFSMLEESILSDIVSVFEETVARVLLEYAQLTVQPGQAPMREEWRIDARQLEDLCEMNYHIQWNGKTYPFSLVLESCLLDRFAGQPAFFKNLPPETSRACILGQMRQATATVSAVVCESSLHLRDLVELEPGDILFLGKKIREPLDVLVNGQFCFAAHAAAQDGKMALVITQPKNN